MIRDPSTPPASWRDLIKVHPAVELSPMMGNHELRELAADIDEHRLQHGIVFYCDRDRSNLSRKEQKAVDELDKASVVLLDGRNRLEAVERFSKKYTLWGDGDDRGSAILYVGDYRLAGDTVVLDPVTCPDPYAYAASADTHRRHLTAEQKRDLIAKLLKATPEKSDRQIAETAKASPTTVGTVRAKLEHAGEVSKLDTRIGADGVAQPATPKPASLPIASKSPSAQKRATAIIGFAVLLRHKTGDTLDDLTRLLRDEQRRIADIPLPRRVTLARGYLAALGVVIADLAEPAEPVAPPIAAEPPRPFEDRHEGRDGSRPGGQRRGRTLNGS
jgi:hypothetical protein